MHQSPQVEVLHNQLDFSRLNSGEVQDVVDETGEVVPAVFDRLQVLQLLARQLRLSHQLGDADHSIERRSNLMCHGGEKFGFHPLARLRRALCLLQVLFSGPPLVDHSVERLSKTLELVAGMNVGGLGEIAAPDGVRKIHQLGKWTGNCGSDSPRERAGEKYHGHSHQTDLGHEPFWFSKKFRIGEDRVYLPGHEIYRCRCDLLIGETVIPGIGTLSVRNRF